MLKIRYKIGLAIALLSLTISSLVGLISLWSSKKIISLEAESKLIRTVESYGLGFEIELQKIYQLSSTLKAFIVGTAPDLLMPNPQSKIAPYKEVIIPMVLDYIKAQKPMSAWIIFNPNLVKGKHTISYEDINEDGKYQREAEYDVNEFDESDPTVKWWYDAIKYGEVWTKPYYWENWNAELISYSKAVFVQDKLIACVGSDFDFNKLRRNLKEADVYQNGYLFLLDEDLNFIIHPNFEGKNISQVIDSSTYNTITGQFKINTQGKINYKLGDQEKVLAFYKLSNGWYIGVAVEVKDIFSGTSKVLQTILIVIVLGIFLSIIIAIFLSSSLTRPLHQVILQFRKGALGQLNVRAQKSKTLEINELSEHFNQFMGSMQTMVNQLKISENNLLIAKHKAEDSDKLKTAFLENISHEVRTPLNAILGFTQILVRDEMKIETRQLYLKYINSNSQRLIKIVEDIMLFSQLEKGILTLNPKQIDINGLLKEIYCEILEKVIDDEKQIDFSIAKPEQQAIKNIFSDQLSIKRIYIQLIENAWKFTENGKIDFGYKLNSNNQPIFFVSDTGIGIPLQEQDKVFNKFYKYQPIKNKLYDGAGLGLSIAQDLVRILGGQIWIESVLDQGTTVYFTVKLDQ